VSDYIDKLVSIYAKYGIDRVRNDRALIFKTFGKTREELANDSVFPRAEGFVEDLQQQFVEDMETMLLNLDVKQQIVECLKRLLNLAMFELGQKMERDLKLETLRNLLVRRYGHGWSAEQRAHVDFVFGKLKDWNTYFLSYTNEGAQAINQIYKRVIERYVPPDIIKQRDRAKDNLLADAIIEGLRKQLFKNGFYDKNVIKVGDNLMAKIGPACGNTFAFVVLVQLETFDALKIPNWCFEEYTVFLAANQASLADAHQYQDVFGKRFNALLTGEKKNVCPPMIPFRYQSWSDRIFTAQRYLQLPRDPDDFQESVRELAEEILQLKYQIIGSVP